MPLSAKKLEQFKLCLSSIFVFQNDETAISSGSVPDLTKFITENTPSELIKTIDSIWAPRPSSIEVEMLSGENEVWSTYNKYSPPKDSQIARMETVARQILALSQQADEVGQSTKQLLNYFVQALCKQPYSTRINNWHSMMMSDYKFFQTLRHITLENGTRPFNDLLIKQAAFNQASSGTRSLIDTMLRVACTRPFLYEGPAHSTTLINYYADLILKTRALVHTKTLQEQVMSQARSMIKQLNASNFPFFGSTHKQHILAINRLIRAIEDSQAPSLCGDIALVALEADNLPYQICSLFCNWKNTDGLHIANTLQLEVIIDTYARHHRLEHDTETTNTDRHTATI